MAKKFVKFDTGYKPDAPQSVLDTTVDELNLHEETKKKLRDAELLTVGEIASYEMRHLYKVYRMGRGDVFAVLRALKTLGVDFKPSEPKKERTDDNGDSTNDSDGIAGNQSDKRNTNDRGKFDRNRQNNDRRHRGERGDNNGGDNNGNSEHRTPDANNRRERDNGRFNGKQQNNGGNTRAGESIDNSIERRKVNTRDYDIYGNKRKNSNGDNNARRSNAQIKQKPQPIKLPPLKNADGLYKFFKAGKWGYKNESGKVVIEPQFDEAYNFSEGMAAVEINEKVGFINTEGWIVIPCRYDTVCSFNEGLASVTLDDKCAYIDKEGNEVFGFEYEAATSFINDVSLVKKDGKWGYMDRNTGDIRLR